MTPYTALTLGLITVTWIAGTICGVIAILAHNQRHRL